MKQGNRLSSSVIILSFIMFWVSLLPNASAETLYGVVSFEGSLVTIDTSTGAATVVGNTGLTAPCGLAYATNQNILYAVECYGGGKLYIIDHDTAAATPVLGTGWSFGQGLAYRQVNNSLYAPQFFTREVARINPVTGTYIETIGEIGSPGELIVLGGLTVRPSDGALFAGGSRVAADLLFTLSTTPGTTPLETEVGPTNRLTSSIAFHTDGTLYASDGDYLYTINPSTGAVTEIGAHGADIGFIAGLSFVTPPVAGSIDAWIRDCGADTGNTPSVPTPCPVVYMSPDIWIDNNEDMIIDSPVIGADNTLRAVVRNRDSGTAQDVTVSFYYRDNTTGLVFPNGAALIGTDTVTIPPNGTTVASVTWENLPAPPTTGGHWCIGVVLNHPDDPAVTPVGSAGADNNVALANIWHLAGRAGESMSLDFGVGTGGKSGFGLQPWPRDFIIKVNNQLPQGWTWNLEGIQADQPFTMKLGEERQVKLNINVPDGAAPHSGGVIDVQQIDITTNTIVGGVNFNLYEDHNPPQKLRKVNAVLVDGQAVLTWPPVIKEANTNMRERVAYYEVTRNGQVVAKVVRDQDPCKPGMQWIDKAVIDGDVTYTVRVADEGGNMSAVSTAVSVKGPTEQQLFNWLTWLLMVILLLLFFYLFLLRKVER